jgi:gliding motility-associated-like protein
MKRIIHIVFLLTLITSFQMQVYGQLPVTCGGSRVQYAVSGLSGSIFDWKITGGTIVKFNSTLDTVDVVWDQTTGYYTLQVTETTVADGKGVCTSSPSISTILVSTPSVNLYHKYEICEGDSVQVNPKLNYSKYVWNTGQTTQNITITQTGWYRLQVTDTVGCTAKDSLQLIVNATPKISLGSDLSICQSITLDAGAGYYGYLWSTGDISQTINVAPGVQTISVEVKDDAGCTGSDTINILRCPGEKLDGIPNAFTPNGDGDNDTWYIKGLQNYPQAVVSIYDRWGRLVFQSKGNYPSEGWDGTSRGRVLPMDSYTYIIDLKDNSSPKVGSVTIIR